MARRHGGADPAFDLEAQHEGGQQLRPADAAQLGHRQQRRRQRCRRMDDGGQMRVAIVEDVGTGAVQEGGGERIDALAAADDGGLPAAGEFRQRLQRQLDRFGAAAGDGDGEEVQQRPLGLMPRLLGNVLPPRVDDEAGEGLGDAWSGKHCELSGDVVAEIGVIPSSARDL